MSYIKHNFLTGETIQAEPFNAMEDQIAANETAIAGKASASDLSALQTAVAGKASAADLSALQTAVGGKASADDLSALSGRINAIKKAVTVPLSVEAGETVTLPDTAFRQSAEITWEPAASSGNGSNAGAGSAFVNLARTGASALPLTVGAGYTQVASNCLADAVAAAWNAGDTYLFIGWHITITGEASVTTYKGTTVDSDGNAAGTLTASGWYYSLSGTLHAADATTNKFTLTKSGDGTAVIDSIYCQSYAWLHANYPSGSWSTGTTADRTASLSAFRQQFSELPLVPGQDYTPSASSASAGAASASAGASVTYDGSTVAYDEEDDAMLVGPGAVIACTGSTLHIGVMLTPSGEAEASAYPDWSDYKWACIGDSLTDSTVNATKKYHAVIAEKTGIAVQMLGVGSTGYTAGAASGKAFIARCAQVDLDADVVTLFGSVNDWKNYANNTLCPVVGTASDVYDDTKTWQENTFCANVNHTFDTLFARVPTAKVIVFGAMPYYGVGQSHFQDARDAVESICRARHIPYVDMYDATGFYRIITSVDYAKAYTWEGESAAWTSVSDYSSNFGHPSNRAHAEIIAPIFYETLKKYLPI